MVNWSRFEKNVTDAIKSFRAKDEEDFAKIIAEEYDFAVLMNAQDVILGNKVVSANKSAFESALKSGFKSARTIKNEEDAQRVLRLFVNTGILAYWTGATLSMITPPPGAVSVVTNLVTSPGIPPDVTIQNTSRPDALAKELSSKFQMHLLTILVLTSAVTATGVPILLPINGLK